MHQLNALVCQKLESMLPNPTKRWNTSLQPTLSSADAVAQLRLSHLDAAAFAPACLL